MSEIAAPVSSKGSSFFDEAVSAFHRLPRKAMFGVFLAAWLGLFHFFGNSTLGYVDTPSLFSWLDYCYARSPDDEHGYIMPLLVIGLMWWKREALIQSARATWWPAMAIIVAGLLIHMGGYMVQQTRLSAGAFFLGLYGLMGMVWGRQFLQAAFFPMFLFVFSVPLGTVAETITFPLRLVVTAISVGIAHHALNIDVIREGSQIINPQGNFRYDVAPACSGIRSLISLSVLTTIYAFLTFQTHWRKAVVILAAIPLAVVGNVARITTVIITAEAFGEKAGAWIEQKLGFLTFAIAIGFIALISYFLREKKKTGAAEAPKESPLLAEGAAQ